MDMFPDDRPGTAHSDVIVEAIQSGARFAKRSTIDRVQEAGIARVFRRRVHVLTANWKIPLQIYSDAVESTQEA